MFQLKLHASNSENGYYFCFVVFHNLLLRFAQRMDDFPLYSRRPSCDTLALAMCDPGLRRKNSSECEEDSLPEVYVDSGLSTLRGSHGSYDSEHEVKGQEEEEEEKEKNKKTQDRYSNDSMIEENSDTEVRMRKCVINIQL